MKKLVIALFAVILTLSATLWRSNKSLEEANSTLGDLSVRLQSAETEIKRREENTTVESSVTTELNRAVKESMDSYIKTKKEIDKSNEKNDKEVSSRVAVKVPKDVVKDAVNVGNVSGINHDTFRLLDEAYDNLYGAEDTTTPVR